MMRRFCRYVEKVFDLGKCLKTLRDSRAKPRLSTVSVWLSALAMFVTRRGSLNAMDAQLRLPKVWERFVGPRRPSGDSMGRVFGLMDPEPLRRMLAAINHQLKRNKALKTDWPMRFAAFDGHEFFSQSASLLRSVPAADGNGQRSAGDRVLPFGRGLSVDRT